MTEENLVDKLKGDYDTYTFMREQITPLRNALEAEDSVWIGHMKGMINAYSLGKKFHDDVQTMLDLTDKPIKKDVMLKGVGLYAVMIDAYMTEEYQHAGIMKRQIQEWKQKNKSILIFSK